MGFDAARVDDAAAIRAQIGDSVRLALVDEATPHRVEDVEILIDDLTPLRFAQPPLSTAWRGESSPGRTEGSRVSRGEVQISLAPADATHLDGDRLYLAGLSGSEQVGVAQLTRILDRWALVAHEIHDVPRRALPDPTIAASVEFVLSEARYAQKRRSGQN